MAVAPYRVIRSNRRTLAIQITGDGQILVRSPYFVSDSRIADFVKSKEDWIVKHQQTMQMHLRSLTDEQIRVLTDQAAREIPARVAYYASVMGVSYGRITIRHQKTRWGSCSTKGNLNFNCLLMLVPPQVLDYVVVHELCHRKEMNHSRGFWEQVACVCPDYPVWRKWLKTNGPALIARLR